MVGDLAGEEMIRESTEPEPEPPESKCGGATWTVLIRVILTPCVTMTGTSERIMCIASVAPSFRRADLPVFCQYQKTV